MVWLTHVCQVAWRFITAPKDWQIDHPHTQKGWQEWMYQLPGISLLSLPGRMHVKMPGKLMEPNLDNTQCGFRRGWSTIDQSFTLQNIYEKSWEYAEDRCTCFVDFGKVYGRVPREKLWGCCGNSLWCWWVPLAGRQLTAFLLRRLCPCWRS